MACGPEADFTALHQPGHPDLHVLLEGLCKKSEFTDIVRAMHVYELRNVSQHAHQPTFTSKRCLAASSACSTL